MSGSFDIVQLRSFVAIADCGGFARAAAALHMSQPAVSKHVRALESRIEQPLVRREGRSMRFTPVGEKLLIEARRILAVHDEALARFDPAQPRTLVVGLTETTAQQVLPGMLAAIIAAFPEHHVQFRLGRSTRVTDEVTRGVTDLGVAIDTAATMPGTAIGTVPLRWYSAPGWTPPGEDEPLPLVAYEEPCGMRQRALQELNERGRRVEIVVESGTLEGVLAAARAGLGAAVLPAAGQPPEGLTVRHDLPGLGQVHIRLIARRGLDQTIEEAAIAALTRFFESDEDGRTRPRLRSIGVA